MLTERQTILLNELQDERTNKMGDVFRLTNDLNNKEYQHVHDQMTDMLTIGVLAKQIEAIWKAEVAIADAK